MSQPSPAYRAILETLKVVRRYAVSVTFPAIATWAIYADYSRTQRYKAKKALEEAMAVEQAQN